MDEWYIPELGLWDPSPNNSFIALYKSSYMVFYDKAFIILVEDFLNEWENTAGLYPF